MVWCETIGHLEEFVHLFWGPRIARKTYGQLFMAHPWSRSRSHPELCCNIAEVAAAQVLMHGQAPFTCERCTKVRKFVNPRIGGNSCPASEQA